MKKSAGAQRSAGLTGWAFYLLRGKVVKMNVSPETTVAELMQRFPNGFAVGPGSAENPGTLSRILAASSHPTMLLRQYPTPEGNQGYLVVDMDE